MQRGKATRHAINGPRGALYWHPIGKIGTTGRACSVLAGRMQRPNVQTRAAPQLHRQFPI